MPDKIVQYVLGFIGKKFDELKDAFTQRQVSRDLVEASLDFKDAAGRLGDVVKIMEGKTPNSGKNATDAVIVRSEDHLLLIAKNIIDTRKSIDALKEKKLDLPNDLKNTLVSIEKFVSNFTPEKAEKIDLSDLKTIVKSLDAVSALLRGNKLGTVENLLTHILGRLNAMKFDFPKTWKLDDMQLRQLSAARGGESGGGAVVMGGPSTNGVVYDGRKVVAVTNTAIALTSTSKLCEEVFITALSTNVDVVVIGGPTVVYTEATRTGRSMNPGDSIVLKIHDLNKVFVNGTSADGVAFAYTA